MAQYDTYMCTISTNLVMIIYTSYDSCGGIGLFILLVDFSRVWELESIIPITYWNTHKYKV